MPPARQDLRLLLVTGAALVVAALVVAAVLLLATGRGGSPTKYRPFQAGDATEIERELRDGGPFFYPDPFGGSRNVLLALENGQVVALSSIEPGTKDCTVKWKASLDSFVDCHRHKLRSGQLARYRSAVEKGQLLIDLRHELPPPAGVPTQAAGASLPRRGS